MPKWTQAPQLLTNKPLRLVPLRHEDIQSIKDWRNEQVDYLRQKEHLTTEGQEAYYKHHVQPTFAQEQPTHCLLSFLEESVCIGYGGLVHIDWEHARAEVSFLVNTSIAQDMPRYQHYMKCFLEELMVFAFEGLSFKRLYTETFDLRPHHIAVLESVGFEYEGRLKSHYSINDQWVDSVMHGVINKNYVIQG